VFVSQHPDSQWIQEARVRIETITLGGNADGAASPSTEVESPPTVASAAAPESPKPAAPASAPPGPRPAAPAAAPDAASAGKLAHGVQLGAFTTEAAARSQWATIAGKHAAQLKGRSPHISATTTANGRLFRLQTAARDEPASRELCRALTAAGQPCVVVHP
jgi:uncharacterized protein